MTECCDTLMSFTTHSTTSKHVVRRSYQHLDMDSRRQFSPPHQGLDFEQFTIGLSPGYEPPFDTDHPST